MSMEDMTPSPEESQLFGVEIGDGTQGWEKLDVQRVDERRYRLLMTPLVTGDEEDPLEYGDVLELEQLGPNRFRFIRRVERGGYRHHYWNAPEFIIESTEFDEFSRALDEAGGDWEHLLGGMLWIHVPRDSSFDAAAEFEPLKRRYVDPVIEEDSVVIRCYRCAQKLRIPRGKGLLRVQCPKCGARRPFRT